MSGKHVAEAVEVRLRRALKQSIFEKAELQAENQELKMEVTWLLWDLNGDA
jgi:hypothetical protein